MLLFVIEEQITRKRKYRKKCAKIIISAKTEYSFG
jgi:hypothetical protein